ncbi:MAG: hypothetical protein AAFY72_04755 [Cyanobacteria bacterium J06649_4]
MKSHQPKPTYQSVSPLVAKAILCFVIASVLGLLVVGFESYSALATPEQKKLAAGMLPKISLGADSEETVEDKATRLHQFGMTLSSGRSTTPILSKYQTFETTLDVQGTTLTATLRVQNLGKEQPVKVYEREVSEAQFTAMWQALRDLETAQLTNLSPYTENLEEAPNRLTTRFESSATYSFYFKDGVYDYPNSFEVYAPEVLKDGRYESLKVLSLEFAQEVFPDVLFE